MTFYFKETVNIHKGHSLLKIRKYSNKNISIIRAPRRTKSCHESNPGHSGGGGATYSHNPENEITAKHGYMYFS